MRPENSKNRLLFLDNLRAFLVVLVIAHHTAITYGAPGDWFYNEKVQESLFSLIPLTYLTSIDQSFFMGLLFFIAGYFTPGSFERKGSWLFLKERLTRLGIPIVFYVIFFNPFLAYNMLVRNSQLKDTFITFWINSYGGLKYLGIGPLWFLEALLIFAFGYVLWERFIPQIKQQPVRQDFFTGNQVLAFTVALIVITSTVRIWIPTGTNILFMQLAYFPQYIAFFIVGILIYNRGWLNNMPAQMVRFWRIVILILLPLLPLGLILGGALSNGLDAFSGGFHWQMYMGVTWDTFMGVAMSIFVFDLFKRRLNNTGPAWKSLSDNSYTMYIIHPIILVPFALAVASITIFPLLKFVLVVQIVVFLIFIASVLVRKISFIHSVVR